VWHELEHPWNPAHDGNGGGQNSAAVLAQRTAWLEVNAVLPIMEAHQESHKIKLKK
jgi:hypothetical protein